jgi:hypothetical protein
VSDVSNAVADTSPNQELASVEEYVIRVNGNEVWRSKGKAMLVDRVSVSNSRGEVTVIGSATSDKYLDIAVSERSFDNPATYLDMIEDTKLMERRKQFEPEPDTSREGYVKADPETGEPMEDTRVPMKDEATSVPENETPTEAPTSESEPSPAPAAMAADEGTTPATPPPAPEF